MKIQKILVPIDFSEESLVALDYAIEFAKAFDAVIDLMHSYQINPGALVPYGPAIPVDIYEDLRHAATVELQKVQKRAQEAGVESHLHLSQDVPASAIVDAAKELSSDLIVIGTRGLTGLKHILLGSVAERTVRYAPCPVLTVGHEA